ncbi:thiol-disulfide oxidoreductase DCC family protein [Silanimonas sp.]|jgi:predicted DCC family thiol-disulfide oxidoreductase YuxK|uniref:thiol-disulfide oxidoreductase DCC family protein n=1 Tax=Silanimonas sp. TaxID=1929290 RepID=UPI0037C7042F
MRVEPPPSPPIVGTADRVIVFDGVCSLCSGWVHFLLARRRLPGDLHFAAMQGARGRALLDAHGIDPDDPATFLYLDRGRAWTDSDALAAVLATLGPGWSALAALIRITPRPLRDAGYRAIARNRYRWFGRRATCLVPPTGQRGRFLD